LQKSSSGDATDAAADDGDMGCAGGWSYHRDARSPPAFLDLCRRAREARRRASWRDVPTQALDGQDAWILCRWEVLFVSVQ